MPEIWHKPSLSSTRWFHLNLVPNSVALILNMIPRQRRKNNQNGRYRSLWRNKSFKPLSNEKYRTWVHMCGWFATVIGCNYYYYSIFETFVQNWHGLGNLIVFWHKNICNLKCYSSEKKFKKWEYYWNSAAI